MTEEPKKKSENSPLAIVSTVALVVPVLALCCAGPIVVTSFLAAIGAWLDQRSPIEIAVAALVTGAIALGVVRWRRRWRAQKDGPACKRKGGTARQRMRRPSPITSTWLEPVSTTGVG